MLGSRRWTVIAGDELEDGTELVIDIVALRQSLTLFEGNPGTFQKSDMPVPMFGKDVRTLVFAISTLNLLVHLLLNLALQDSGTGGLIETSSLQYMRGIDPIIVTTAHN